jgi:hypothetical protein
MEKKADNKAPKIDLEFNGKNELIQAIINMEILGKPKCKTRRNRFYGAKGNNR